MGPRPEGETLEETSRVTPSGHERPNHIDDLQGPPGRMELSPSRRQPVPSSFRLELGDKLPLWGNSTNTVRRRRMCGSTGVPAHDFY